MKRCPTCSRVYADDEMRFCLDDGAFLMENDTASTAPETIRIPPPKGTGSMRTEVLSGATTRPRTEPPRAQQALTLKQIKIILIVATIFVVSIMATKIWINGYGDSELRYQAANGNTMRMRLLLFFGAVVDSRDETRGTALMGAAWNGHTGAVKSLLDNHANVNLRNDNNETALMLAAKRANPEIIKLLLEKDPELNTKDDKGWTALMCAAWGGNEENVRLLLKAGADPRVTNNLGETASYLASKRGNTTVQMLLYSPSK